MPVEGYELGGMNLDHAYTLDTVKQFFTIPVQHSFTSGLGNALVYKFYNGAAVVKMYNDTGKMEYGIELWNHDKLIHTYFIPMNNVYRFTREVLSRNVIDLINKEKQCQCCKGGTMV